MNERRLAARTVARLLARQRNTTKEASHGRLAAGARRADSSETPRVEYHPPIPLPPPSRGGLFGPTRTSSSSSSSAPSVPTPTSSSGSPVSERRFVKVMLPPRAPPLARAAIGHPESPLLAWGLEEEDERRSAELDELIRRPCSRCGRRVVLEKCSVCSRCRKPMGFAVVRQARADADEEGGTHATSQ